MSWRSRLLAATAALGGCQWPGDVCGHRTEPVVGADGGEHRCVTAEDCPRPGQILLCVTEGMQQEECVSCEETRCVRYVPEPCP